MTNSITHVFFDLDRTLWDFTANSRMELKAIWTNFNLHQKGISLPDEFIRIYEDINAACWALYRKNEISKDELRVKRFYDTLLYYGIDDSVLAGNVAQTYTDNSPQRTIMIDGTYELLDYLKPKFSLHIITNGFMEVQRNKINNCNLSSYFKSITSSEEVGVTKPNPKIFEHSLKKANANAENSVYIGDDFIVDIKGAHDFGMQAIYFNPHNKQHDLPILGDVQSLLEIKDILN